MLLKNVNRPILRLQSCNIFGRVVLFGKEGLPRPAVRRNNINVNASPFTIVQHGLNFGTKTDVRYAFWFFFVFFLQKSRGNSTKRPYDSLEGVLGER